MNRVHSTVQLLFGKHLLLTNTATSSILMATGDIIEQHSPWNRHKKKSDWQRTLKMLGVGLCLGPLQHFFYKIVDHRYPSRSLKTIGKKIFIDQTVASPLFIVGFFLSCGIIENKLDTCYTELKEKFLDIYVIDCLVWPPSQFLNFLFCSPKYRMLYVNFTTMIYDIFLSYVKHQDGKPAEN